MSDDTFDDEDDFTSEVLIDFKQEITMIRLMDATFLPSWVTISAELIPTDDLDDDKFEVAITKMRFWLEAVVSRCIAFSRGNKNALAMLVNDEGRNNSNNLLMLCPNEPSDDHLAALLQAKLSALGQEGGLIVGSVQLESSNMSGLTFRFVGNADEVLPEMDDWIGEHSYFGIPWWGRDDASTLDVIPPEDADLSKKPDWAYSLDFLSKAARSQSEVVLRPDFKPKVIDGGQPDE